MDAHDLERTRPGIPGRHPLNGFPPTLVIGITSDILYPPEEQMHLASKLPGAELAWLDSPYGHDAFLIETDALDALLRSYRAKLEDGTIIPAATGGEICPL
ncbi:homoserine O-acetyltransferase [mine drainage metagenome]|uniref:Homoserine O-acetyltransferase n=3 Tax=mine drainage metagenome TaxID=410659 RepID=T1BUH1_9ZZZZ